MSHEDQGSRDPYQAPGPAPVAEVVTLTVVAAATGYRTTVRVSAQAPAQTLVPELGGPVGVPEVADLLRGDGASIPPASTLASVGLRDGDTLVVVGIHDMRRWPREPMPVAPVAFNPWGAASPPPPPAASAPEAASGREAQLPQAAPETPAAATADMTWPAPETERPGTEPPETAPQGHEPREREAEPDQPRSDGEVADGEAADGADGATTPAVETAEPATTEGDEADGGGDEDAAEDGAAGAQPVVPETSAEQDPDTAAKRPRRWMVGAGAGVAAVVLVAAGLAIGGSTMAKTKTATASGANLATAEAAVKSWLAASPYPAGAVVAGADVSHGRTGTLSAAFQVVGSSVSGPHTDVWFVVVPAGRSAVGLTVRLTGGQVAGAPSVSPLPFGGGTPPPLTGGVESTPKSVPEVATWASRTFGSSGALTTSLGVGLRGTPQVVGAWSPKSPAAGSVLQVQVDLSSTAPGTAASAAAATLTQAQSKLKASQAAVGTARASLGQDRTTVTHDSAAVAKDGAAVQQDSAAVAAAGTANTNAANALAQVTAAANAANAANAAPPPAPPATAAPPTPVPDVAPDQAAATAAAQGLSAAQAQLTQDKAQQTKDTAQQTTDQAKAKADQVQLARDQAQVTSDRGAVSAAQAKVPSPLSAVGTYNLWVVSHQIRGWVPAGYQGH
jgi:hypothetical protein